VWPSVASDTGFYDQAHMINEFRDFAGAPPTTFFKPHDPAIDPLHIRLRRRPNEWLNATPAVMSQEWDRRFRIG